MFSLKATSLNIWSISSYLTFSCTVSCLSLPLFSFPIHHLFVHSYSLSVAAPLFLLSPFVLYFFSGSLTNGRWKGEGSEHHTHLNFGLARSTLCFPLRPPPLTFLNTQNIVFFNNVQLLPHFFADDIFFLINLNVFLHSTRMSCTYLLFLQRIQSRTIAFKFIIHRFWSHILLNYYRQCHQGCFLLTAFAGVT